MVSNRENGYGKPISTHDIDALNSHIDNADTEEEAPSPITRGNYQAESFPDEFDGSDDRIPGRDSPLEQELGFDYGSPGFDDYVRAELCDPWPFNPDAQSRFTSVQDEMAHQNSALMDNQGDGADIDYSGADEGANAVDNPAIEDQLSPECQLEDSGVGLESDTPENFMPSDEIAPTYSSEIEVFLDCPDDPKEVCLFGDLASVEDQVHGEIGEIKSLDSDDDVLHLLAVVSGNVQSSICSALLPEDDLPPVLHKFDKFDEFDEFERFMGVRLWSEKMPVLKRETDECVTEPGDKSQQGNPGRPVVESRRRRGTSSRNLDDPIGPTNGRDAAGYNGKKLRLSTLTEKSKTGILDPLVPGYRDVVPTVRRTRRRSERIRKMMA